MIKYSNHIRLDWCILINSNAILLKLSQIELCAFLDRLVVDSKVLEGIRTAA